MDGDVEILKEPSVEGGRTVFIPPGKNYKVLQAGRLMVVKGKDLGKELEISKERVTIGRSRACDLVLSDPTVSHLHAEVVTLEYGRLVRDLGSRNGIWFAGHRVGELHLQPGSRFQVGAETLRFDPLRREHRLPFSARDRFGAALGRSISMREVFLTLEKAARSDAPVLLVGDSGTGKELLASALHNYSLRAKRPFLVFDCAAVVPQLMEANLFGYEKGSFTGALESRPGLFEQASGGSLVLDEIAELGLELQPKLLRVIEQKTLRRLGGRKEIEVDVRLIATTKSELGRLVDEGRFREDLYFRLNVIEVRIPPLKDRREDIIPLAEHFLQNYNEVRKRLGLPPVVFSPRALEQLKRHDWPGNVRELRNRIERAAALVQGDVIDMDDLFGGDMKEDQLLESERILPYKQAKQKVLEKFEKKYLTRLLQACGGNLSRASERAGLVRHHLRQLCRKYGILPSEVAGKGRE
ncbi:MAG: FHA domain-containing protein [Deltaproteobacteria bacterium]|nr:MAG: FHA domain-containing protein [Deltaproteobacteria bacterium]